MAAGEQPPHNYDDLTGRFLDEAREVYGMIHRLHRRWSGDPTLSRASADAKDAFENEVKTFVADQPGPMLDLDAQPLPGSAIEAGADYLDKFTKFTMARISYEQYRNQPFTRLKNMLRGKTLEVTSTVKRPYSTEAGITILNSSSERQRVRKGLFDGYVPDIGKLALLGPRDRQMTYFLWEVKLNGDERTIEQRIGMRIIDGKQ